MDAVAGANPFLFLERNARTDPSGVFLELASGRVLNSEGYDQVKKLAYEFRRRGVKPGDVIALALPESLTVPFIEAVFHEAAVSTILPRGYEPDSAFRVDWTFSTSSEETVGGGQHVMVDDAFLAALEENPTGTTPKEYPSEESLLWILFSSGTTGRPNAIPVSLRKLDDYAVTAIDSWMQGDPFLSFMGAATPLGLYAVYISVRTNRPFLSTSGLDARSVGLLAERNAVTSIKASPIQLAGVIDALEAEGRTLPNVQTVYTVGTAMAPALAERLRAVTDGCEIYALYGSTEAGMAFVRYYETEDPFDVGHLFPGASIEIVDEDDAPVPHGEVGRIRLRGPVMINEYLGNPEGTRDNFKDGWFYPGDLGFLRPDGGLTLRGRSSEVINAGGVKIDPALLDLFALGRPGVLDAASFGYTASSGLQQIGIALQVDAGFDVRALVQAFETEFGPAAPKLVARVDEVPRNSTGKAMRLALAKRYDESVAP